MLDSGLHKKVNKKIRDKISEFMYVVGKRFGTLFQEFDFNLWHIICMYQKTIPIN